MYRTLDLKTNLRLVIERGFNYCVIMFLIIEDKEYYCVYPFMTKKHAIYFDSYGLKPFDSRSRVMFIPDAIKEYDFLICE